MPTPQSSAIKSGIISRLDSSKHQLSYSVLIQFIGTLSKDIALAWTLWSAGLVQEANDVTGVGIGAWSGTGQGGHLQETTPFNIVHTWPYNYEYWNTFKGAITAEFKETFGKYAKGFEQTGVNYVGTCGALPPAPPALPAGAPGPIAADAIPATLVSIKASSPNLDGIGDRIHKRLPAQWQKFPDPLKDVLKAIEGSVKEQFTLWETTSQVSGDKFVGVGYPPLGAGTGKSLGIGKIE